MLCNLPNALCESVRGARNRLKARINSLCFFAGVDRLRTRPVDNTRQVLREATDLTGRLSQRCEESTMLLSNLLNAPNAEDVAAAKGLNQQSSDETDH